MHPGDETDAARRRIRLEHDGVDLVGWRRLLPAGHLVLSQRRVDHAEREHPAFEGQDVAFLDSLYEVRNVLLGLDPPEHP